MKDFFKVVRRLVRRTDRIVDEMLISSTGKSHWNVLVPDNPSEIFEDIDGKAYLEVKSEEKAYESITGAYDEA
ncbi:hypothetical protein [Nonomuraea africana]|uniref:hypothetical protein n=1 Tax=Nonomuraea africana TaxID=46171 RepID=UPI0031D218D7